MQVPAEKTCGLDRQAKTRFVQCLMACCRSLIMIASVLFESQIAVKILDVWSDSSETQADQNLCRSDNHVRRFGVAGHQLE